MTQLFQAGSVILLQLNNVINQITQEDFRKPSVALSQASVGQHLRHTLEFFICLMQGYEQGVVNYDKRSHNKEMESHKAIALKTIAQIQNFVQAIQIDKSLKLEVAYQPDCENCITIESNYLRELTYNIEHAVHHMAIMKIGIREVASYVQLPADFGIAVSTIRFRDAEIAAH